MIIRPCAEFTSDLPTDQIETEDGMDFLQFGGKSVAEANRAIYADALSRLAFALAASPRFQQVRWYP